MPHHYKGAYCRQPYSLTASSRRPNRSYPGQYCCHPPSFLPPVSPRHRAPQSPKSSAGTTALKESRTPHLPSLQEKDWANNAAARQPEAGEGWDKEADSFLPSGDLGVLQDLVPQSSTETVTSLPQVAHPKGRLPWVSTSKACYGYRLHPRSEYGISKHARQKGPYSSG